MFQKGHTYSIGNKGGRKAKKIEMELAKEIITQDALIALANSKVYKQLVKINEESGFIPTKEMALPITLKGMIERKDLTSGGKPIPILPNRLDVSLGASQAPQALQKGKQVIDSTSEDKDA